jgi:hypothetical protein
VNWPAPPREASGSPRYDGPGVRDNESVDEASVETRDGTASVMQSKTGQPHHAANPLIQMVGVKGFEPSTHWSQITYS